MVKKPLMVCCFALIIFLLWALCFASSPSFCHERFNRETLLKSASWKESMEQNNIVITTKILSEVLLHGDPFGVDSDIYLALRRKTVELNPHKRNYYQLGSDLMRVADGNSSLVIERDQAFCKALSMGSQRAERAVIENNISCKPPWRHRGTL